MKNPIAPVSLLAALKQRMLGWLLAGVLFTMLFSATVAWINSRGSAERTAEVEVKAMAKSFRAEILSGQIKTAEMQMRTALMLKSGENVKVVDENFAEIYGDSSSENTWPWKASSGVKTAWTGIFSLVTAAPVYFDQEESSLFGYVAMKRLPPLNWNLMLTIFGSLMLGQFIFAWIYRSSIISVGGRLSRQLAALGTSLDEQIEMNHLLPS